MTFESVYFFNAGARNLDIMGIYVAAYTAIAIPREAFLYLGDIFKPIITPIEHRQSFNKAHLPVAAFNVIIGIIQNTFHTDTSILVK